MDGHDGPQQAHRRAQVRRWGLWLLYHGTLTGGAAAVFLALRQWGARLTPAQEVHGASPAAAPASDVLLHVLLALVVIIVTARLTGMLFRYFHQPPVMGEVLGGIVLGPSVLGRVLPGVADYVLPASAAPMLGVIAQLGIILYMFLVGLDVDLGLLKRTGRSTAAISHASIVLPFLLGSLLALLLYPRYASGVGGFTSFALFLGVSMSVTAFPVLARILADLKLQASSMGATALMCAAINDVAAWCLLALVVNIVHASAGNAILTPVLTLAFVALVLLVIRPIAMQVIPRLKTNGVFTEGPIALVLVAVLMAALATEFIGIHAIFGAFLLGTILPRHSVMGQAVTARLEDMVKILLLPIFFAFTGMRTEIGLLNTSQEWLMCGAIILIATAGKFGGTFIAARFTGHSSRDSAALGILMNTRGLVELIVLNVGLDLGVISPTVFTMLVIMAVVTTFATTPIFNLITRKHPWTQAAAPVGAVSSSTLAHK